ncbi:EF-hand domain-containing protein [Novosphingobium sp. Leaf2]|uniref:EF-hand domain-containing protein n=1 Tax=Novosphingobium sp. Leaf2 TaxID=1735670 RepID=UPI0006FEDD13|nr:EF-hand domain-containing protein [Novosphingobium sp. Leaf2]KQM21390.1 hypothetical protein ASE49_15045 [Novosphingobium sp. Leaf2]
MNRFRKLTLGLSMAALAAGGVAVAQAPAPERGDWEARRDAPMTRAQAQAKAERMFDRLDVNHDGTLDEADRQMLRQQMREKIFDRLDTNHDGTISKAEFMADKGPEGHGPGMRGPDGGPDGDGPPPPPPGGPDAEGGKHHGMHGPRGFGPGMKMMKDGPITRAAFVAEALKRFDAEDTNHDGTVTKEERQAAHARHRAEWQANKADNRPAN